ncbi:efflux transporter outer membrane subunit [Stenotrophomonas sp. YIM B06876]|uniref:efflux transporter outer membrane subunit n=1 Tax=Stenotrophomonas sp. YIM B06876 TaxID=3060211 RepID=UPI002738ED4D|nr:efflux transporter outer membrane subunit [Stenotrophomonas sp. YIM B06876]
MKMWIPPMRPLLLSFAIATALAGCVSAGRYGAATLQVPAQYGRGDALANTPTQVVANDATHPLRDARSDAWWQGFGDTRLDRLVAAALDANADLAAAGLRLHRARLQAGLATTDLWPVVNGSLGSSGSRAIDTGDSVRRSNSASVSLGWEIDLWGRLRTQRDVAQWEASASAEDRENTVLLLVGEICRQYWQLAYLNQSIASGEDNLERLRKTRELVQVQFDAGAVSRLQVNEAAQNLESQRASQSQLLQQRVETRNAITVLLDGNPWPQADEPQNLDDASSPALAAGIPADLLARRPDLRAAELRLRQSLASIKLAATRYYPALSLTGSVGSSSGSLSEVLSNPVATLGAGLSLPFLRFREMQLDTRIAGTSYQIAATGFRTTLYTALAEVDNALSAREQLTQQVASAQASFDAAVEVERLYAVRYRAGATDLRIWLDAQQTRRSAELSLAQIRRGQLLNDVTLFQALGGSAS